MLRFLCALLFLALANGLTAPVDARFTIQNGSPEELIQEANELFAERFVQEKLERAISLYEQALSRSEELPAQRRAFLLNRLAQLHYELATFDGARTAAEQDILAKGKDFGFRSLRLHGEFARSEGTAFARAVGAVNDPAALLWTANNWGETLRFKPLEGLRNVNKVIAMYRRCLELDESFQAGSCHHALGATLVTTPGLLGSDAEAGQFQLRRALELQPDYLENHIVYAEFWGFTYSLGQKNGLRDRGLIERQAQFVLDAPVGDRWPFWNRVAKKEAHRLLQELQPFVGGGS